MLKRKSRQVIKWIGIVTAGLVMLVYIGLPVGLGIAAVFPSRVAVGSAPDGFEDVILITEDNEQLKGWYKPPANGTAIILLHGAGSSRESLRPYIDMLTKHGFGVLTFDLRGHGESMGKTNRLGWQGTKDLGAAVVFLQGREEVREIGGMGLSMGGEVLLGAASQYPSIQAIMADGASRRSTSELLVLESERPLVRNFTARVMYGVVQLLNQEAPPKPLLDSMVDSKSTRFLLIAAGNNQLETAFNQLFAQAVGNRALLWIAAEADHTGAFSVYPQEYEQRVVAFFGK